MRTSTSPRTLIVSLPLAHGTKERTMPANRRNVVHNPKGGWDVKGGGSRSSGHFDTQKQAIDKANKIVDNLGGGEVTVHGRDGKIRDSDTRAPGRDPNPPRDKK